MRLGCRDSCLLKVVIMEKALVWSFIVSGQLSVARVFQPVQIVKTSRTVEIVRTQLVSSQ